MKCSQAVLLLSLAIVLGHPLNGQAERIFEDTFEGTADAGWVINNGGWSLSGNRYQLTNSCGYHWCSSPLYHEVNGQRDYVMAYEFEPTPFSGNPTGGGVLYARIYWTEPANYGLAAVSGYHLDVGYNDLMIIARLDSGVSTYIATTQGPQFHLTAGKTYVVAFGRSAGILQAKVFEKGSSDPGWQLTVADGTYSGNYFGIDTWNTVGFLDNVAVDADGPVATQETTWGRVKAMYSGK